MSRRQSFKTQGFECSKGCGIKNSLPPLEKIVNIFTIRLQINFITFQDIFKRNKIIQNLPSWIDISAGCTKKVCSLPCKMFENFHNFPA